MSDEQFENLTLSQLESHLWEAANILRGSPVDRTDWKSYILPLLFESEGKKWVRAGGAAGDRSSNKGGSRP